MKTMLACVLSFFCLASHAQSPAQGDTVTLAFVGDIMLAETPGDYVKSGRDPFAHFAKLLGQADIAIGNLECVVGTHGAQEIKPYTFLAHPRVLPLLHKHFSAVSLANNHTGDFGPAAFTRMLGHLDRSGLKYFGGGASLAQAHEPLIFHKKGKTIALLGYSDILPRSFEALPDRAGTAWSEDDFVAYDIQRAKDVYKADIVIVYPHWGIEYDKTASARQTQLAHLMIDQGADAVVGGHPHVTQNIEVYKGKPIFYSLGNFVFNGFDDDDSNTGWLLELDMAPNTPATWRIHEAKIDGRGIPRRQRREPTTKF